MRSDAVLQKKVLSCMVAIIARGAEWLKVSQVLAEMEFVYGIEPIEQRIRTVLERLVAVGAVRKMGSSGVFYSFVPDGISKKLYTEIMEMYDKAACMEG